MMATKKFLKFLEKGVDKSSNPCYNTSRKEVRNMKEKEFTAILAMLQEQDKELNRIFAVRQAYKEQLLKEGGYQLYNDMHDALFSDGEKHWGF